MTRAAARPRREADAADAVSLVHAVQVPRQPVSLLEPVIGGPRYLRLAGAAGQVRHLLAGRGSWCVSSTATGGGVAEMLQVLLGYVADLGISAGWLVVTGDAELFAITKRLHNQIHGAFGAGPLGAAEAHHYMRMLTANAVELLDRIAPCDVVQLHHPQTAGWCGAATSASTGRTTQPGPGGTSCGRTWAGGGLIIHSSRRSLG